MRAIALTNEATDLATQKVPFLSNYTVVFANPTGGELVVQGADDSDFTSPVTIATVPADGFIEGTFSHQYARVSTAATVYALGN